MKLSEFNYYLPKNLIAQSPLKKRDETKMLVIKKDNRIIEHHKFKDILKILDPNYFLVFNNSKVIPAKLEVLKDTGGKAEFLFIKKLNNYTFFSLIKSKGKKLNKIFFTQDKKYAFKIIENNQGIFKVQVLNSSVNKLLQIYGKMPLPPYIKKELTNKNYYQNIYAQKLGSIAAPTAGFHFTKNIFKKLQSQKIEWAFITLHISLATFLPLKEEEIENHKMYFEEYTLTKENFKKIYLAKKSGKKILAIGTTTVRVLETLADIINKGKLKTYTGKTNLFIYPNYQFKVVDAVLTNFHLPKTTLLLLVYAFGEKNLILDAYKEAIKKNYRFYSFGDCMLIS